MILDQEQLIASYPFLARRYQRVAIRDATELPALGPSREWTLPASLQAM